MQLPAVTSLHPPAMFAEMVASIEADKWIVQYAMNAAWQMPLLVAAAWLAARLLRREGAAAAHIVWTAALWLGAALPLMSVAGSASGVEAGDLLTRLFALLAGHDEAAGAGSVTVRTGPLRALAGVTMAPRALIAVCVVLVCVAGYFGVRLAWSQWRTQWLLRTAKPLRLGAAVQARWDALCERFGVAAPAIAESPLVRGPVIVGARRAILLLPPGFVEALSAAEIDAAFAHELAHVQRRDVAWHIVALVVALPLRWHPLTWFVLARMEQARESACDAMAAAVLDGPRSYARSLLELAAHIDQRNANPSHALGLFEGGAFERRIMQLIQRSLPFSARQRLLARAGAVLLCGAVCASALAMRTGIATEQDAAASPAAPASSSAPLNVRAGIMAEQMITKVNPVYPPEAKAAKVQGTVVLIAVIAKDGTIQNLRVQSGPEELQHSAIDAVRQWVYKPYLLNGNPTEVTTEIRVTYTLAN